LAGARLVDIAADVARAAGDDVVVVLPPGNGGVEGGATRSASVRNGLAAVPDDADVIVVHDAARPLASAALFAAVIDAVRAGADGAIPVVPVTDTIKRVDGARVIETLERAELVAVQTPQAFRADALRKAHAGAGEATDDAALVESIGGTVVVVAGDPANIKVTTADDLRVAEALLP
jgi:2-C-methyl-D-erythritol 4-phosphate cytidylyltransferase